MATLATVVKADIENGFGTWKVKLNVNILFFGPSPPRQCRKSGKEGGRESGGNNVDGGDSTRSTKIRENEASRDRRKGDVGEGKRGRGRAGLTFVIVNGRRRAKEAKAALRSLHARQSRHHRPTVPYDRTLRLHALSRWENVLMFTTRQDEIRTPSHVVFVAHELRNDRCRIVVCASNYRYSNQQPWMTRG